MEDYYPDEISIILEEYSKMNEVREKEEYVCAEEF